MLARLTTIGTGGPARFLAPTGDRRRARRAAPARGGGERLDGRDARARVERARCRRRGRRACAAARAATLAAVRVEGETLVAGGGAANAVCLHRAREAGLGGFEFASAIPGTAGGGVRMNAGAYGSDWRTLCSTLSSSARTGGGGSSAEQLELAYRHSNLRAGRGRGRGPPPPLAAATRRDQSRGRGRSSPGARPPSRPPNARSAASSRTRRGSAGAGSLIEGARPEGAPDRWRRDLEPACELHRERGRGDERRRARADGPGAEPGARALRRHPRARGALPRPARAAAPVGKRRAAAKSHWWRRPDEEAPRVRSPRGRRSPRSGPQRSSLAVVGLAVGAYLAALETSIFAVQQDRDRRWLSRRAGPGAEGARTGTRTEPAPGLGRRDRPARRCDPRRRLGARLPLLPRHAPGRRPPRARRPPSAAGELELRHLLVRPGDAPGLRPPSELAAAPLGATERRRQRGRDALALRRQARRGRAGPDPSRESSAAGSARSPRARVS